MIVNKETILYIVLSFNFISFYLFEGKLLITLIQSSLEVKYSNEITAIKEEIVVYTLASYYHQREFL
jgi:hypothetical protein